MNIYDLLMAPLERRILGEIRAELVPLAEKTVLEIGIGTGVNLRYYDYTKIDSIIGLDRKFSGELKRRAAKNMHFIAGDVECMPFATDSFDSIVGTLVLCSANPEKSLREILRILKPGGKFIFIEHIRPRGSLASKLADRLNRVWPILAQGCNLNRQTDLLLKQCGFADVTLRYKSSAIFCYGFATAPL